VQAPPEAPAIPHAWHLHVHGPHARVPLTLREVAMAAHRVAALGSVAVGIVGSQHGHCCRAGVGQEPLRALA
jgi:hypothetical protein